MCVKISISVGPSCDIVWGAMNDKLWHLGDDLVLQVRLTGLEAGRGYLGLIVPSVYNLME